jgi:hypothetical protein
MRNTTLKFILDQTVGAALNTIAFSASMALFRVANRAEIIRSVRRDFWPLMSAGLTVWPLFSLLFFLHIYTICIDENVGGEFGKHGMGYLYHSCYYSDMNYVNT